MDSILNIQQVANETGLSLHTLRYYERIGLLDPIARNESGHRRYRMENLEWIILLIRLRSTDMPIAKMKEFADLVRQGDSTIAKRVDLLEDHQRKLNKQMEEIQATLLALDEKLNYYRSWELEQQEQKTNNK
ncbi:MerR family transcriptional regulator [Metabacillus niabensis]|uniref:MerR family transcriptional regulator n=1 Tax=Metabacillus niabensis TaxID=324854 RepID=UPI001CF94DAD|nr:MerR family transcriptional regulator [Metabacillus niabensis]